jgi:hypothetical protein
MHTPGTLHAIAAAQTSIPYCDIAEPSWSTISSIFSPIGMATIAKSILPLQA